MFFVLFRNINKFASNDLQIRGNPRQSGFTDSPEPTLVPLPLTSNIKNKKEEGKKKSFPRVIAFLYIGVNHFATPLLKNSMVRRYHI